jgi:hypothetical protein
MNNRNVDQERTRIDLFTVTPSGRNGSKWNFKMNLILLKEVKLQSAADFRS